MHILTSSFFLNAKILHSILACTIDQQQICVRTVNNLLRLFQVLACQTRFFASQSSNLNSVHYFRGVFCHLLPSPCVSNASQTSITMKCAFKTGITFKNYHIWFSTRHLFSLVPLGSLANLRACIFGEQQMRCKFMRKNGHVRKIPIWLLD